MTQAGENSGAARQFIPLAQIDRPNRTVSASQAHQPIYQNAVGCWRVYKEFLGPLVAALGTGGAAAPRVSTRTPSTTSGINST